MTKFKAYKSELKFYRFKEKMTTRFNDEMKKGEGLHIFSLLVIFLIGTAIRIYLNFFKPFSLDEGASFNMFINHPLYRGLTNYFMPGNHLFYTFLAHISSRIFGMYPFAIRLPALIAGILTIPASYLFVRRFYNKHAALLASAFVASSFYLITYSLEARGYSIVTLFSLIILIIATYLKQNRNLFLWYLLAIFSALGAYTITIMLYPVGIVLMFLFLSAIFKDINLGLRSFLIDMVVFMVIIFLMTLFLYSPVIVAGTGLKSIVAAPELIPIEWMSFVSRLRGVSVSTWQNWNYGMPFILSSLLVIGFFVSIFSHRLLSKQRVLIVLSTALWIIPFLLIQRVVGEVRVWLFLLPIYLGVASSGLYYILSKLMESKNERYKAHVFAILSIIIVVFLGVTEVRTWKNIYYERHGTLRDPDYVSSLLKLNYSRGDALVYLAIYNDFDFYYHFMLNRVPLELSMPRDVKEAKRLLVYLQHYEYEYCVNCKDKKFTNLTVEDILRANNLSVKDYSPPKILLSDEHATIYALDKL